MLARPVSTQDGTVEVAVSIGAAAPDQIGTTNLHDLQRAADTAMYEGKHLGHAQLATPAHTTVASINGRRAGRPGTGVDTDHLEAAA